MTTQDAGTLTLIGSGELAPSMAKVHRAIAARLTGGVRPVFVDTPAGFEPNVDRVAAKACAYIERHLGVPCEVASFRSAEQATPAEVESAVRRIRAANYIFAGPGSPTYAIRNWRGTPVLEEMAAGLRRGAHLVFASAAAIAVGAWSLPIYEIYKAGEPLRWVEGTDLLAPLGLKVTVVPHWNNTEGGGHDTRHCYMGEDRFELLKAQLEPPTAVLGIDEHTACIVDAAAGRCDVMGAGGVTVQRGGEESVWAAGASFGFDELRSGEPLRPQVDATAAGPGTRGARLAREASAARALAERRGRAQGLSARAGAAYALAAALDEAAERGADASTIEDGRAALAALLARWGEDLAKDAGGGGGDVKPYVDLLLDVRAKLRDDGAWALSDAIRDGLTQLGVVVEDRPAETVWRRA